MREKGQTKVTKTLETPVFSRGIGILTEKSELYCRIYLTKIRRFRQVYSTKNIMRAIVNVGDIMTSCHNISPFAVTINEKQDKTADKYVA